MHRRRILIVPRLRARLGQFVRFWSRTFSTQVLSYTFGGKFRLQTWMPRLRTRRRVYTIWSRRAGGGGGLGKCGALLFAPRSAATSARLHGVKLRVLVLAMIAVFPRGLAYTRVPGVPGSRGVRVRTLFARYTCGQAVSRWWIDFVGPLLCVPFFRTTTNALQISYQLDSRS